MKYNHIQSNRKLLQTLGRVMGISQNKISKLSDSPFYKQMLDQMDKNFKNDPNNPGLHGNVVNMLRAHEKLENLHSFIIKENFEIKGRTRPREVEIYLEFEQLGNIERTIIMTISNREVNEDDVEKLYNLREDLHYFPSAILYYDNIASDEAKILSKKMNVALKHFHLLTEITKTTTMTLENMLPEGPKVGFNILGDPFWTIMAVSRDGKNNGTYYSPDGKFLLFLSKKQALNHLNILPESNWQVFGVSQEHLRIILSMSEKMDDISSNISICLPEFEQTEKLVLVCNNIPYQKLARFFLRG